MTIEYVQVGENRIAYQRMGASSGTPLLLVQRYRGTMNDWDPLLLAELGAARPLIVFDNAGVSRSSGHASTSIGGMAQVAIDFLDAMGVGPVDALGFSMGGAIVQSIALERPECLRRIVIAGSGPGGVADAPPVSAKVIEAMTKAVNDDEDFLYLFFTHDEEGRAAGRAYLSRIRAVRDDAPLVSVDTFRSQARAIQVWSKGEGAALPNLDAIRHPVLVANGHHDVMIPAYNSFVMAQRLPDARLVLYPRAGHAFLFQYARLFGRQVNEFLDGQDA